MDTDKKDEDVDTDKAEESSEKDSADESTAESGGLERVRKHRILVRVLLALATILAFFAMFSVWINRQLLNTDNWVDTSGQLLENPKIQEQLSLYLVDQLYAHVNVEAKLASALPAPANKLAGPAAAGLQQLANKAVLAVLEKPETQQLWRNINRAAHTQLLNIVNGNGKAVSTQHGEVTLNTRAIVDALGQRLGVEDKVNAARAALQGAQGQAAKKAVEQKTGVQLPANTGQLVILRSNNVKTFQDVTQALRPLAIWLTLLGLLGYALAVYLARGWRREALRTVGLCFFGLGLVVLLTRTALGNWLVDSLVKNDAAKPAGHAVFTIGSSLLVEIGQAMVGYGIVLFLAAWIAGPTRLATGIRRAWAPAMRERPGVVYGVVAIILLLVFAWGPTKATREFWGALILILLVILGVELLRRKTVREFPEAQSGETVQGWRDSIAERRSRGSGGSAAAPDDKYAQLERLSKLHDKGALTAAEFKKEKAALLDS